MLQRLTILFAVTTVLFGVLYFIQGQGVKKVRAEIAALKRELFNKSAEIHKQDLVIQTLKEENEKFSKESESLKTEIAKYKESGKEMPQIAGAEPQPRTLKTSDAKEEKSSGKQIIEDPEMQKKKQREQRKDILNGIYDDLFKELALSPEELEMLKDLLIDKIDSNKLDYNLFKNVPESEIDEYINKSNEDRKKIHARIKEFLGDERYEAYQEYQKTIPYRQIVTDFKSKIESSNNRLDEWQESQLLQTVKEEAGTTYLSDLNKAIFEKLDNSFKEEKQISSRVFDRANSFLTLEQSKEFKAFRDKKIVEMKANIEGVKRQMEEVGLFFQEEEK